MDLAFLLENPHLIDDLDRELDLLAKSVADINEVLLGGISGTPVTPPEAPVPSEPPEPPERAERAELLDPAAKQSAMVDLEPGGDGVIAPDPGNG